MQVSIRILGVLLVAALGFSCVGPIAHHGSWVLAKTEHFEIVSAMNAKRTAELAESLERFRFFAHALTGQSPRFQLPTRIYALDRSAWSELVPANRDMAGFFRPGMRENHVLLRADGPNSEIILFHEYVHFLMSDDSVAYPLWYSEGFAELLSTIKRSPEGWTVAGASHRIRGLRRGVDSRWALSLRDLRGQSRSAVLRFYSHAWALVRYLIREREDGPRRTANELRRYLALVERGEDWDEAFEQSFDVSFDELDAAIAGLRRRRRLDAWQLPAERLPKVEEAEVSTLEGGLLAEELGWLSIVLGQYRNAETYFRAAIETAPTRSRSHVGLGDALKFQGLWDEAEPHYSRGLAIDDESALNHLDYGEYLYDRALRLSEEPGRAERVAKARHHFVRSWKLDPKLPETYAVYGMSYLEEEEDLPRAVEMLERAHSLLPGEQQIQLLLARAYAAVGRRSEAIRLLERSRAHAGRSEQVADLIEQIRAEAEPEAGEAPQREAPRVDQEPGARPLQSEIGEGRA